MDIPHEVIIQCVNGRVRNFQGASVDKDALIRHRYKSDISFDCPKCGAKTHETIDVPEPAWVADRASDMTADEDLDIVCEECNEGFWVHVHVAGGHCDITFNDFPNSKIEASHGYYDGPDPDDEWFDDVISDDPYNVFMSSYDECTQYLVLHGGDGFSLLNRMVFAQHISALEAYLSDTLIGQADDRNEVMLALLQNDKKLLDQKFGLKEFLDEPELVKKTVRKYLRGVIHHNLPAVDSLYRYAFNIDLFNLMGQERSGKLIQAIKYRHDCVHRNGKDKDDKKLDVFTKEYVTEIGKVTYDLVKSIEEKRMEHLPF